MAMKKTIALPNGCGIPVIGIGTSGSNAEVIQKAVCHALESGYRHFDCAHVYQNEQDIGKVLNQQLQKSLVKREDLFIASKLGVSSLHPDIVTTAFETTLKNLCLEYLDLYYIHWPFGLKYDGPVNNFPTDIDGNPQFDETFDFMETWRMMEKLYYTGRVKAIGVSNFNISQLQRLLGTATIRPSVHQFECHPYLDQREMIKFCRENGIAPVAYSPLCCKDRNGLPDGVDLFIDPVMQSISNKYEKSIAQVALRFQLQQGVVVIPRSTNQARMKENLSIFDFCLADKDMAAIMTLNKNFRIHCSEKFAKHRDFPF